jgi:hypothetical protein
MSGAEGKRIGRSIRLFLVDGAPTGLMIAEIVNWTGKAIVVPRAGLADFLARPEAKATGVYLLAGPDPDDPFRPIVYVGEAEEVGVRLRTHDKDETKDFFERAIVFVSKDENLTKAHARFLEARVAERVRDSGRAKWVNGNAPGGASIPEADREDMDYYLVQMELMLPALGLDVLRPMPTPKNNETQNAASPVFSFVGDGYDARMQEIEGEFILKAGSLVRAKETAACPNASRQQREAALTEGLLVKADDAKSLRLTKDMAFTSPSSAAKFAWGGSVNGRVMWKIVGTGTTYADWREAQLMSSMDGAQ